MPLVKSVLDTNVIVSAHLNSDGFERLVLRLGLARKIQLYVSNAILAEYEEVLYREQFGIERARVAESLTHLRRAAILVRPKRSLSISADPDDNMFLECAESARADYLVTGNKRHFPKRFGKTQIVNARELVQLIALEFKR